MIPVLIPARNEVSHIGRALEALPRRDVSPVVIANACTDNTAEVASWYGAAVLSIEEQGRMVALQAGIKHLGSRALKPFLILDADSAPLSREWAHIMTGSMQGNIQPTVVSGPLMFEGKPDMITNWVRTSRNWTRQLKGRQNPKGPRIYCGANQAVHLVEPDLRDKVLDIPNYWPGSDKAFVQCVTDFGGQHISSLNPLAMVMTDGSRSASFLSVFGQGYKKTKAQSYKTYIDEAPEGSTANRTK